MSMIAMVVGEGGLLISKLGRDPRDFRNKLKDDGE